ncbi:MAG: hypothetical protein ABR530_04735, partial [Pyrinomonadaceae bacterium]
SGAWRKFIAALAGTTIVAIILLSIFVVPRFADADSVRPLIRAADERGLGTNPVLILHTISHNAEFYAAGRLIRDKGGKQKRFSSVSGIKAQLIANNSPILVLVPLDHLAALLQTAELRTELLSDNGELALVLVSP